MRFVIFWFLVAGHYGRLTPQLFHLPTCPNSRRHLSALPWDAILGAEVVKAYKPSPQVYVDTAEILGLDPAEVCMVAAHNGDLAAAHQCGLKTAFVVRPLEHGPSQQSDLRAEQRWDYEATDLNDLATQLGSPSGLGTYADDM